MRKRRILAGFLLAALVFAWMQNDTIRQEEFEIASGRLPAEFDGFRIVLLADLHGREFGYRNQRLLRRVEHAEPDLIVLCGDLTDAGTDLHMVEPLACGLTELAATVYVTGNHEWAAGTAAETKRILRDCGATVLENEFCLLARGDTWIVLAGAEDPNGPYDMEQPEALMAELRETVGDEAFTAVLYHRNDALERWAALDADLLLSGHGHGGIVRIPGVGGLFDADRSLWPDYAAGEYRQGNTVMVVSRGLGGGPRLLNRPDLPVIVLRTES